MIILVFRLKLPPNPTQMRTECRYVVGLRGKLQEERRGVQIRGLLPSQQPKG